MKKETTLNKDIYDLESSRLKESRYKLNPHEIRNELESIIDEALPVMGDNFLIEELRDLIDRI